MPSPLAEELSRLADEARASRERLEDLSNQAAELKRLLEPAAPPSPGEHAELEAS